MQPPVGSPEPVGTAGWGLCWSGGGLAAVRRAPARRRDCPAGCGAAAGVGSGRILGLGGWPGRRGGARSGHPAWRPGGGALRGDRAPRGPVPAFGSGLSGGWPGAWGWPGLLLGEGLSWRCIGGVGQTSPPTGVSPSPLKMKIGVAMAPWAVYAQWAHRAHIVYTYHPQPARLRRPFVRARPPTSAKRCGLGGAGALGWSSGWLGKVQAPQGTGARAAGAQGGGPERGARGPRLGNLGRRAREARMRRASGAVPNQGLGGPMARHLPVRTMAKAIWCGEGAPELLAAQGPIL